MRAHVLSDLESFGIASLGIYVYAESRSCTEKDDIDSKVFLIVVPRNHNSVKAAFLCSLFSVPSKRYLLVSLIYPVS